MGDGFLEQRAFLAVADNTPFERPGGRLFVNLFGGFLVRPHVITLPDHTKMQSGFLGHFHTFLLPCGFSRSRQEANLTKKCNPSAIGFFTISLNVSDY